jgi:hypothetical protein
VRHNAVKKILHHQRMEDKQQQKQPEQLDENFGGHRALSGQSSLGNALRKSTDLQPARPTRSGGPANILIEGTLLS